MRNVIHWVCNENTPYNAILFRALAADPSLDLLVHFIREAADNHPWQTPISKGFRSREYRKFAGIDWTLVKTAATDRHSLLVVGSWHEPTVQLALTVRRLLHLPYVIWTDTPAVHAIRHPLKAFLRSGWLRWLFTRASAVMGTGSPALEALVQMGCPKSKLVNFPYFIDIGTYHPRPAKVEGQFLRYFSCGRLHTQKGYDLALRALAAVYSGSSKNFIYHIAGTGPEAEPLAQLASELGIRNQVEFLGWCEHSQLHEFYAQADVLLHPARYEPYGVAILEAMAFGAVAIASDATMAAVDRIRPGSNGFIHHTDDADDLSLQIRQIVNHPERINEISAAARVTTEEWPVSRAVTIIKQLAAQFLGTNNQVQGQKVY